MKFKIDISIWFSFIVIYLELIFKLFVFQSNIDINTLYIIVFDAFIIIILSFLSSILKEKINYVIIIALNFFITILFAAQSVYYNFYSSLFSFYSLKNGTGQVLEFYSAILNVMAKIWYILLLIFLPFLIFIIIGRKIFNLNKMHYKTTIIYTLIGIISVLNTLFIVNQTSDNIYSFNRLYYETHASVLTAEKTGLITMINLDLKRYLFGFEEKVWVNKKSNNSYLKMIEEEKELDKVIEYNILDIDFNTLIENEKNENIKNMHIYFNSLIPTQKNKYTGIFEGKNLIFITAEAFDTIAIDPVLTPTLYKMANNSYFFTNYYQPIFPVSTSDGEYMNMNSLIPKEGVWSMYRSSFIEMPFGIGNMFDKLGYLTNGYHNHYYNYYDRDKSHPNLGLNYIGCGNGLEKRMGCKNWPNSDYEMIEATYPDYINESTDKFMTYYMTVSGHLNYNYYGNNMASKNYNLVKELNYSDAVKAYLSCNIELDKAMESLLKHLEESGILNDTLIVISPDHYPYGLKESEINEISEINRDDYFELYHTTLIMYNPTIKKTVIDKYISSIDILPTVYNLFNLKYDSRLLMGNDIFSEKEGLVILSNRSFITDKGRYNSITRKFYLHDGETVDDDYVNRINEIVYQKFTMSSLILTTDYYNKLNLNN